MFAQKAEITIFGNSKKYDSSTEIEIKLTDLQHLKHNKIIKYVNLEKVYFKQDWIASKDFKVQLKKKNIHRSDCHLWSARA